MSDKSTDVRSLTVNAKAAYDFAREEALRLRHSFITVEHVVLGIIKLGRGTAHSLFTKEYHLDPELIKQKIEKTLAFKAQMSASESASNIEYTARTMNILLNAQKEASSLGNSLAGTEHILLAILIEGNTHAAKVLLDLNVILENVRTSLTKKNKKAEKAPEKDLSAKADSSAKAGASPKANSSGKAGDSSVKARDSSTKTHPSAKTHSPAKADASPKPDSSAKADSSVKAKVIRRLEVDCGKQFSLLIQTLEVGTVLPFRVYAIEFCNGKESCQEVCTTEGEVNAFIRGLSAASRVCGKTVSIPSFSSND